MSRQQLYDALAGLTEQQMTVGAVEGVWTIKDILGHIASWERAVLEPLRCYAAGGPYEAEPIPQFDPWNLAEADRKRAMPLAAVRDELEAVRAALIKLASELPRALAEHTVIFSWGDRGTIAYGLDVLCGHEWQHTEAIRRWRARVEPNHGV